MAQFSPTLGEEEIYQVCWQALLRSQFPPRMGTSAVAIRLIRQAGFEQCLWQDLQRMISDLAPNEVSSVIAGYYSDASNDLELLAWFKSLIPDVPDPENRQQILSMWRTWRWSENLEPLRAEIANLARELGLDMTAKYQVR